MLYSINNYLEKVSFLVLGFQFHFIECKFWNLLQLNRVLSRNFCLGGGSLGEGIAQDQDVRLVGGGGGRKEQKILNFR